MVEGPRAGLDLLATLDVDSRIARYHRFHAVRGHLLDMAGGCDAARHAYQLAARLTTSIPERDHLRSRIQACADRVSSRTG